MIERLRRPVSDFRTVLQKELKGFFDGTDEEMMSSAEDRDGNQARVKVFRDKMGKPTLVIEVEQERGSGAWAIREVKMLPQGKSLGKEVGTLLGAWGIELIPMKPEGR